MAKKTLVLPVHVGEREGFRGISGSDFEAHRELSQGMSAQEEMMIAEDIGGVPVWIPGIGRLSYQHQMDLLLWSADQDAQKEREWQDEMSATPRPDLVPGFLEEWQDRNNIKEAIEEGKRTLFSTTGTKYI